jgi:hypothetical protein
MSRILSTQNKELGVAMTLLAGSVLLIIVNLIVVVPAFGKVSNPPTQTPQADPIDTNAVNEALTVLESK